MTRIRGFYKDAQGRTRPITGRGLRARPKYEDIHDNDFGSKVHDVGADVPGRSDRYLYHITDKAGLLAIVASGEVKPMTQSDVGGVTSFTDNPKSLLETDFQEQFYDPKPSYTIVKAGKHIRPSPVHKEFIIVFDKAKMVADGVVKPVKYDLGSYSCFYKESAKKRLRMHEDASMAGECEFRSRKPVKVKPYVVTVLKYDQEAFYHGSS